MSACLGWCLCHSPLNCNMNYKVPYKYRKMHLTTIQCFKLRLAMCKPHLLGMPSLVKYTWHTSRIHPLVDKEPSPFQHFGSYSFSSLFLNQVTLWCFCNPPRESSRISLRYPIGTDFDSNLLFLSSRMCAYILQPKTFKWDTFSFILVHTFCGVFESKAWLGINS